MTRILRADAAVNHVLSRLQAAGYYDGRLDAAWGPLAEDGLTRLLAAADASHEVEVPPVSAGPHSDPALSWGAKVSRVFRDRVRWIADDLGGFTADDLMDCMAWESNNTFRADIRNMAGSGATGLIQFMPLTALGLFYTAAAIERMTPAQRQANGRAMTDRLAAMTPEDQLNYVYKYFRPFKGRLRNLGDLYMAILWPPGVGQPDTYVLWTRAGRPTTYRQNAGLDVNKDGAITRAEALVKIRERSALGRRAPNYWPGG